MIRIANGQGFWGDWLDAPVRLLEQGPIDFLTLDYLAEVTMSILQKQRQRDPALGYARDFPPLIGRIAPLLADKNVKVIANAGGVNPAACAREILRLAPGLKVAVVTGDDVLHRLNAFLEQGHELRNMDTGEPLARIRSRVLSANAYLGAFPLAEALQAGPDVVLCGRSTDTALALAPMIDCFGWRPFDYDLLAAGTVAGHLLECGAQSTGGNCSENWQAIADFANIGYPIVEADIDGTFCLTKHPATGGRVDLASVKEQLLYEIGDPRNFLSADCRTDFTSIQLKQTGPDRVRVSGVKGGAPPADIKLSISYHYGWKAVGTLVYCWPDARKKAEAAGRVVLERLRMLGLEFEEVLTELLGVNACHGPAAPPVLDPPEVQLRIGVRDPDQQKVERFTREMIPLVLGGPPGATGYGEGRPRVKEVVAFWPALVPRELIQPKVEVFG
jgi:Acyclic terpene utilisation family protein AtuA